MYVVIRKIPDGRHFTFYHSAEDVVKYVDSFDDLILPIEEEIIKSLDSEHLVEYINRSKPKTIREVLGQ